MSTQKKILHIITIIILLGLALLIIKLKPSEHDSPFTKFQEFTIKNPTLSGDTLCTGGFINTENIELDEIAQLIIETRVINSSPLQFATTQDEAGITCLASSYGWVLFSALNNNEYYCIDSTGKRGRLNFDRATLQCE